jgi:hypothetical protein
MEFRMQIAKICCLAVFFIAGCTSTGQKVNAPTLTNSQIEKSQILDKDYQTALNNTNSSTFDYENQHYLVTNRYVSALGRSCVRLEHSVKRGQRLLFCQDQKSSNSQWFQVADVVASLEE